MLLAVSRLVSGWVWLLCLLRVGCGRSYLPVSSAFGAGLGLLARVAVLSQWSLRQFRLGLGGGVQKRLSKRVCVPAPVRFSARCCRSGVSSLIVK